MIEELDDFINDLQDQIYKETKETYGQTMFERWLNPLYMGVIDNPDSHARITGSCGDTIEIFLLDALAALGITPQQINVVLLTHLHPDHIGHKDLFPGALFMFHKDERLSSYFKENKNVKLEGDVIFELSINGDFRYVDVVPDLHDLGNCIYIRHCPGHTKGSMVIFACIEGRIHAIVGGIFLNKAYYDRWEPPGMSWKQERIYEHMAFIKENADVIVPGHGTLFRV